MFHHFHDDKFHTRGQGSISKDDFYKIIKFIGRDNILDARVFFDKFKEKKLRSNEVCFTFDDAIKCQIDVALPILEELKIKSFFFVYTSIFENNPGNLEIFRYFRMNYYKDVNEFYKSFYKVLNKDPSNFLNTNENKINKRKIELPNYSIEDLKFRFVRDIFLKKKEYEDVMFMMMEAKKFNYSEFYRKLFFSKDDLIELDKLGHLVGLHSHSHNTFIENLSFEEQKNDYQKCLKKISGILNKQVNDIKFMSHPCGSYNNDTLKVLEDLGIEMGFREIMLKKKNFTSLELPRQDHMEIYNRLK